jgi:hypothetical protein
MLNRNAQALYEEHTETLRLIRETSDPKVRQMWKEDLHNIHKLAHELLDSCLMEHHNVSRLRILVSRDPDQWYTLTVGSSGAVVPAF